MDSTELSVYHCSTVSMRYYNYYFFILLFIIRSSFCMAQNKTLLQIMRGKDDSAKISSMNDYASVIRKTDPKGTRKIYLEMTELGRKLNDPYWTGIAWFNLGDINNENKEYEQAWKDFSTAVTYFSKAQHSDNVARCYVRLSELCSRLRKYDEEMNYLLKAIDIFQKTGGDNSALLRSYNSAGILLYNIQEYKKALIYFLKAEKISKTVEDNAERIYAFYNISACYSGLHQFDSAKVYAQKTLAFARSVNDDSFFCIAQNAFVELYTHWRKSDLLKEHARQLIEYAIKSKDVQYEIFGVIGLAESLYMEKKFKESISYFRKALEINAMHKGGVFQHPIYKKISEVYEESGKHREALDNYKQYIEQRDTIANEKMRKNIAELELEYQTAEKQKELVLKQLLITRKEIEIHKNKEYLGYSIAALAVILLLSGYGYLYFRNKKEQQQRTIRSMEKDREIQLLQSLMDGEEKERTRIARELHDGISGMLSAAGMHLSTYRQNPVSETELNKAIELIGGASTELRKTAHNLLPEVLHQYGLSRALQAYCEAVSSPRSTCIEYHVLNKLPAFPQNFELAVYRIVQELIHNAIRHAQAKQILVQLSEVEGLLTLTVEDDGQGFLLKDEQGAGLFNIKQRVHMINGVINWESSPGNGTSIYAEFETANFIRKNQT